MDDNPNLSTVYPGDLSSFEIQKGICSESVEILYLIHREHFSINETKNKCNKIHF